MIGYLRGKVLDHQDGRMMLGIAASADPEAPMVGYHVAVPGSAEYGGIVPGKTQELFIHTHVREDALDLYGFATRSEKELFLLLLTVNGIGPKGALGLLSCLPPSQLLDCVLRGDKDSLVKVPGVGKKTAERLVLELSDPLRKRVDAGLMTDLVRQQPVRTASKTAPAGASAKDAMASRLGIAARDARDALVGLGYREQDVSGVLEELVQDLGEGVRAEQLVRSALQRLG